MSSSYLVKELFIHLTDEFSSNRNWKLKLSNRPKLPTEEILVIRMVESEIKHREIEVGFCAYYFPVSV